MTASLNRERLIRHLPERIKRLVLALSQPCCRLWHLGTARYCPLCNSHLRHLLPHGFTLRSDARCPVCGSLERHRLLWLFLQQYTDLFAGTPKRLLHIAPERALERQFRRLGHLAYLTADLRHPRARMRLSVTALPHPAAVFDAICCSHVLEHVEDDRQAMREFHRVLVPGGWAVIMVPITAVQTFEDPLAVDPGERIQRFGQRDHVRCYGPDVADRLREVGFRVEIFTAAEVVDSADFVRFGLRQDEVIYYCVK